MTRTTLKLRLAAAVAFTLAGGCAPGEQANKPPADSTARNLTIAQPESGAALRDVGSKVPATTTPHAPPVRTPTKAPVQVTKKTPPPPPAPVRYTAASGTFLDMAVADTISSRSAKPGQEFTASVVADVKDAAGHVVIPAGSTVHGTIDAVKPAPNPNTSGTLTLSVSSVTIRGTSYPLAAHIDSLETVRKGRGVTRGDAAKVGGGAAAGAILGRILGGNAKGTVIGGIVGGAAGAAVAAGTKDADIVLPKGAHINATLTQALAVKQ
jgi:hypothetical protein